MYLGNECGTILVRSSVLGLQNLGQCPQWWVAGAHNSVPMDRGRAAHCRIRQRVCDCHLKENENLRYRPASVAYIDGITLIGRNGRTMELTDASSQLKR